MNFLSIFFVENFISPPPRDFPSDSPLPAIGGYYMRKNVRSVGDFGGDRLFDARDSHRSAVSTGRWRSTPTDFPSTPPNNWFLVSSFLRFFRSPDGTGKPFGWWAGGWRGKTRQSYYFKLWQINAITVERVRLLR